MRGFKQLVSAAVLAALFVSSSTAFAQSGDNKDRRVEIHNHSGKTIGWIYASNVGTNDWQEDLLRSRGTLDPGEQVTANLDDGTGYCQYDVKVKFMYGGNTLVRNRINVCAVSVIDIYSDRIEVQYP